MSLYARPANADAAGGRDAHINGEKGAPSFARRFAIALATIYCALVATWVAVWLCLYFFDMGMACKRSADLAECHRQIRHERQLEMERAAVENATAHRAAAAHADFSTPLARPLAALAHGPLAAPSTSPEWNALAT